LRFGQETEGWALLGSGRNHNHYSERRKDASTIFNRWIETANGPGGQTAHKSQVEPPLKLWDLTGLVGDEISYDLNVIGHTLKFRL
jgi:hypothetical protein